MRAFLEINNIKHSGWESIKIVRSIENLTGAFQLRMTNLWDELRDEPIVKMQDACKVKLGDFTVIDGYIDNIRIKYNAISDELIVMGRDKSADLVDCSATNGTGEYKNLKIEEIITSLCKPFGINVVTDIDTGQRLSTFNVDQGETVHEAIQKICSLRAALALFDNNSNLLITRAGTKRTSTSLVDGQNILSGIAEYDYSERFSKYIVKGQTQFQPTIQVVQAAEAEGIVTDPNITRFRPMLIIGDGQMNTENAVTRAKWEASTRVGRSQIWEFTVTKWTDDNDILWQPNYLINVQSTILGVLDELLIIKVEYVLDETGQKTKLTLMEKSAFDLLATNSVPIDDGITKYVQGSR